MIHADLTLGNVSAWHYWWLLPRGDVVDTNAALADRSFELAKRTYALGHYARFVRPGFTRIGATDSPAPLVFSTAFESPDEDQIVVVLSSDRSSEMVQEIRVAGSTLAGAEVWVTDSNRTLEITETVDASGESLSVTIPPNSVVTVVMSLG
jgi:glucuronoarabinoxylan endo-1,4-beta-xylanase